MLYYIIILRPVYQASYVAVSALAREGVGLCLSCFEFCAATSGGDVFLFASQPIPVICTHIKCIHEMGCFVLQ